MRDSRELQTAPREDEVEVALPGSGYGESIVVHIGEGSSIVVDSCINDAEGPKPWITFWAWASTLGMRLI